MPDITKPRLPPGQIVTKKWPVLHYGTVPSVDLSTWRFAVRGAVERPLEIGWEELNGQPRIAKVPDRAADHDHPSPEVFRAGNDILYGNLLSTRKLAKVVRELRRPPGKYTANHKNHCADCKYRSHS